MGCIKYQTKKMIKFPITCCESYVTPGDNSSSSFLAHRPLLLLISNDAAQSRLYADRNVFHEIAPGQ